MPKGLILYSDTQLTQEFATLPIGQATAHLSADGSELPLPSVEDGFFIPTSFPTNYLVIDSASGSGTTISSPPSALYGDGFSIAAISVAVGGLSAGSVYCRGANIMGGGLFSYSIGAVSLTLNEHSYICIGSWSNNVFSPLGCFTENALGSKAYTDKYGDDTGKPGTGITANGGWGAYDFSSGNVGLSGIPAYPVMPVNRIGGHLHFYMIDEEAYNSLSRYLWGMGDTGNLSEGLLWQKFKNYKFNPIAAIIACHRLPQACYPIPGQSIGRIDIAGTALGSTAAPLAGLIYPIDANVQEVTIGSIVIPEQYGTFLDYEGGVKIEIVLPFCGRFSLDPSAILGATTTVKYRFDRLTGNCCAFVLIHRREAAEGEGDDLILSATGNAAQPIPFTGHDDGSVQMLGTLTSAALGTVGGAVMGNALAAATSALSGVKNLMMQQEHTQITGDCSGGVAYVSGLNCYMIISYARPIKAAHYDDLYGRPTFYGAHVGDYTGLTFFGNVDVQIAGADPDEQEEIRRLLQGGVIL